MIVQSIETDSVIQRLDPRARIILFVLYAGVLACCARLQVLAAGLAVSCVLAILARIPPATMGRRLAALNGFLVLIWLTLPFSVPGAVIWHAGPLQMTGAGFVSAAAVTLKGNALMIALTSLVGTLDPSTLGRAMQQIGVPAKLAALFFLTARYITVLHQEYVRLRNAMKARGFQPGVNLHTYRTFGYLAGLLLVRSIDRSERILAAMKCRGFNNSLTLNVEHGKSFAVKDVAFSICGCMVLASFVTLEFIF